MSTQKELGTRRTITWALALVVFAAVYRVVSGSYLTALPNFSPTMAMAFCCGFALPGLLGIVAPIGFIFLSDLILNATFGQPIFSAGMIASYACYFLAITLGRMLQGRGLVAVGSATLFNALFFYVVTNVFAWYLNPLYPQTAAGLVQSLTWGLPGLPPSLVFLRNSLVSDFIFTAIFLVLLQGAGQRSFFPKVGKREIA